MEEKKEQEVVAQEETTQEQTFNQEQLNKILGERLAKKEEKVRAEVTAEFTAKIKEYEEKIANASAFETSNKELLDQNEKLKQDVVELESLREKVRQYESDSVKIKVSQEMGLPISAIEFLKGNTEEEIKGSAESLKAIVGTRTQPLANSEAPKVSDHKQALLNTLKGFKGD